MDVVSSGPLPVASVLWQPRPSAWLLTVVCKATFLLRPTESVLAAEQLPPNEHDCHWNDDVRRSLHAASDLAPVKPRADVVLVGHAFAPGGAPVRSLIARLTVGELDKAVAVFCDRAFGPDGLLQEGQAFTKMPLLYERAAGGPDTPNPVGVRGLMRDAQGRSLVPNLQPPGVKVTSRSDVITPIGFGPIAPLWPSRREKIGRQAAAWSPRDWTRQPLPEDIDYVYFNDAPRDQQLQGLRDNERIALENLHPEHPRLVTALPGVRPRAVVERAGGATQPLTMRCDTLWIDTDRSLCTLTWRAQVPLEHPKERGRVLIAVDGPVQGAAWSGGPPQRSQSSPQLRAVDGTETATLPPLKAEEAHPFGGAAIPGAVAPGAALPFAPQGQVMPFSAGVSPERAPRQNLSQSSSGWAAAPAAPASAPSSRQSSPGWAAVVPPAPVSAPGTRTPTNRGDGEQPISAPMPPAMVQPPAMVDSSGSTRDSSPWGVSSGAAQQVPLTVGQLAAHAAPAVSVEVSTPAPVAAPRPASAPMLRLDAGTTLQLVWYDPEEVPRMRRKKPFQEIIRALEDRPLDAEADDPAIAKDPMAVEDRREVFEVLVRGEAVEEAGLNEALQQAVREDGRFVAPLLLLAGELQLGFDELERLKAVMTTVAPFAAGDELLTAAIEDAKSFLGTPNLLSPPAVTEGFTKRIEEAFAKTRRSVPQTYLGEQAERVLLEKRCYQRREVFGATHLRALLQLGGAVRLVPAYLPEETAKKLPMYARFRARLLAVVELQEDQYEAHPAALRVTALGRLAAAPRR